MKFCQLQNMSILIIYSEMEQNLLRAQGIQWFNCEISWIQKFMYHLTSVCVCSVAQLCLTLFDPMNLSPPGSSVHRDSPGKNTGFSCHALLQRIFPTQGSNPGLLHCRQILSHQGRPCTSHQCTTYLSSSSNELF